MKHAVLVQCGKKEAALLVSVNNFHETEFIPRFPFYFRKITSSNTKCNTETWTKDKIRIGLQTTRVKKLINLNRYICS
jgi:hypothetical protein